MNKEIKSFSVIALIIFAFSYIVLSSASNPNSSNYKYVRTFEYKNNTYHVYVSKQNIIYTYERSFFFYHNKKMRYPAKSIKDVITIMEEENKFINNLKKEKV